jgi:hypothetical protein
MGITTQTGSKAFRLGREKLSPHRLVASGWRRGLRRHVGLCKRRAQGVEARGVGELVLFDEASDRRRHRGVLVVGQINYRHGPDIIGRK